MAIYQRINNQQLNSLTVCKNTMVKGHSVNVIRIKYWEYKPYNGRLGYYQYFI